MRFESKKITSQIITESDAILEEKEDLSELSSSKKITKNIALQINEDKSNAKKFHRTTSSPKNLTKPLLEEYSK